MRHSSTAIRQFLHDQALSGQTIAAFCQDRKLKVPTFYSWKRKYDPSLTAPTDQQGFCELVPKQEEITQRSLYFSSGFRLDLSGLSIPEIAELILQIDRAHA